MVKIAEAASGLFSPRYFPARTAPPDASMTPTPKNKENIGMTRLSRQRHRPDIAADEEAVHYGRRRLSVHVHGT
ncbi:MAG: hypothetical protein ACLSTO_02115 [Bilophila wadsworthia]